MPYKPSAFAKRILRKLASGAVGRRLVDGDFQIGATALPAALVEELRRHDLVESARPGCLTISVAGRAFVRRNLRKACAAEVGDCRRQGEDEAAAGYRRQHQVIQSLGREIDGKRLQVLVNIAESPLNWLAQRKDRSGKPFLSPEQVEAGERLRRDFTRAGMTPRMTSAYDGVPVSGGSGSVSRGLNVSEAQLSAHKRFSSAMDGVGPDLSEVLLRVCCFLEGIGAAERQLEWPARSGKIVLKIALDRLAHHYGSP